MTNEEIKVLLIQVVKELQKINQILDNLMHGSEVINVKVNNNDTI